jgi:hypothetical protein
MLKKAAVLFGLLALAHCSSTSSDGDSNASADASTTDASANGDASTNDAAAPDGSPTTSDGGVACGCNGQAGCAEWTNVYVTWYGYNDNSCGTEAAHGCNDIANPGLGPKMHTGATAGTGTYDDPSTAASSDTTDNGHAYESANGATLTPGTILYNPEVQQYFIFEDSCLECGDEYACKKSADDTDDPAPPAGCTANTNLHIDFWMGPNDAAQPSSLDTCEDNATLGEPYNGVGVVLVNPPPNLPVRTGALYPGDSTATGGCFTSAQANVATCP